MQKNPYKYTGPLDPVKDRIVCISRENEINKVIYGIKRGDYYTILGPRQIGKTTFLRQLIHRLSVLPCIYIDMEISPSTDEAFYKWIIDILTERIPAEPLPVGMEKWKEYGPELNFYYLLRAFKPKGEKRVIFLFDEIEKTFSIRSFLHIWRKVFNERNIHPELNKYSVIIAGGVDLISLTIGPTSPFNIAMKLYLSDFSIEESERLILEPFELLGITLDREARKKIIDNVSGHPQLLQHLCYILIEQAFKKKKSLTKVDVDVAIEWLILENSNLSSLDKEVKTNKVLEDLIRRILNDEKIDYVPHQELSTTGTGPIIQHGKYCAIRNNIYKDLLTKLIKVDCAKPEQTEESVYVTTIYLDEIPHEFTSIEQEKSFLKCLFNPDNTEVKILKNKIQLNQIDLDLKEKLIFCYLAYKNYKAMNKGFLNWKQIPCTWQHRLSSNIENNKKQIPEWDIFTKAFDREPYGDDIRSWIFSLRQSLDKVEAKDIIHSETGRGRGYLLKGAVNFSIRK